MYWCLHCGQVPRYLHQIRRVCQSHETTASKTERTVAPGDVSAGGPRIQTRSMTKSSTCVTN